MLTFEIASNELAPRKVRAALARTGWSAADDLILVASELVTSAVRHAGSVSEDCLRVAVDRIGERVRISVEEPAVSPGETRAGEASSGGLAGMGLQVVERVAARWGSERADHRLRVWAELTLARRRSVPDA